MDKKLLAMVYKNGKTIKIRKRGDGKEKQEEREEARELLQEAGFNPIQIMGIIGFTPKKKQK